MPTTPTSLADALREIERLRAENEALRDALVYARRRLELADDSITDIRMIDEVLGREE